MQVERPSFQELESRIQRMLTHPKHSDLDVACWLGYIAGLLEWGLISIEDHRKLGEMLKVDPDPSLPIFLGEDFMEGE